MNCGLPLHILCKEKGCRPGPWETQGKPPATPCLYPETPLRRVCARYAPQAPRSPEYPTGHLCLSRVANLKNQAKKGIGHFLIQISVRVRRHGVNLGSPGSCWLRCPSEGSRLTCRRQSKMQN
jgi:hypothetical protein